MNFNLTPDSKACRILVGMWQTSGGWGKIVPSDALNHMKMYASSGYNTFDMADHYGPAEDLWGLFVDSGKGDAQGFTKWVPRPGPMTREVVEKNINVSLKRMKVDCLDMLQFHWWDYNNLEYITALRHLSDLQTLGKIKHLGLTNFDTNHVKVIVDSGIKIVSNQVQFSVVDMRPVLGNMAEYCKQNGISLLTYGTVLGGLLSDKWLGKSEPTSSQLPTPSMRKYKNMIDAWGGWNLFQELLSVLNSIGIKHNTSISNVGIRFILDQPSVGGVIIGARLGISEHINDLNKVFELQLDDEDRRLITNVQKKSRNLLQIIGDCGDEYR